MKVNHPKFVVVGALAVAFVLAVFYLPILPYAVPGTMGGGGLGSLSEHLYPPYPADQPDHLPVYKVTDFVSIAVDTDMKYEFDGDETDPTVARAWMAHVLEDGLNLPLPDGVPIPEYIDPIGSAGPTYHTGFDLYSRIDGLEVYPFHVYISTTHDFDAKTSPDFKDTTFVGYENYKLEKVGEAKILSAQEAHKLLNEGNDISMISRPLNHAKSEKLFPWAGVPVTSIKLKWYYPPAVETDWGLRCDYLLPVWVFRNSDGYGYVNAYDGDVVVDWSPEGKPNFTPNERFAELKDVRPRPWVTISQEHPLTDREATIYTH
nr:hypothetical protein [uncultured Methanocorpusculum sp.]